MDWTPRDCTFSTNNIIQLQRVPLSHYYICSRNSLVHVHLSLCRDNPIIAILTHMNKHNQQHCRQQLGQPNPLCRFI